MSAVKIARERWQATTPLLWYSVCVYVFGNVLYGYDASMFGGLQALPGFLNSFGEDINGKQALSTDRKAIINSVIWIGKALGTLGFEPVVKFTGFRGLVYTICVVQMIGVIVELAAKSWQVFSVGRTITYVAVGLVVNTVPGYCADVCPAGVRGFFTGFMFIALSAGQIWSTSMCLAFANDESKKGWMITVGLQLVPSTIMLLATPFTPESPRWYITRGKKEQAYKSLKRLRPARFAEHNVVEQEIEALTEATEQASMTSKGRWIDIFRGNMFRRTMIASWLLIFQESTGTQFVTSYGPTFYKLLGLSSKAFLYNTLTYVVTIVVVAIAMYFYDVLGRRPILIIGTVTNTIFMFVLAGVGRKKNFGSSDAGGIVTSMILSFAASKASLASVGHIIGAEIGGVLLRKKVLAFSTFCDVVSAFVNTFTIPYLIGTPGLHMGPNLGFVFGVIGFAALVFVVLFVPECKGRSLEEIEELFSANLWAWQFTSYHTTGLGSRVRELELGHEMKAHTAEEGDLEGGNQDSKDIEVATYERTTANLH